MLFRSHARIRSVILNSDKNDNELLNLPIPAIDSLQKEELELLRLQHAFPSIIAEACLTYSPALIANFVYELARNFNQFYHEHSVLKAESQEIRQFRLQLSLKTGYLIRDAMKLLGIAVPERM